MRPLPPGSHLAGMEAPERTLREFLERLAGYKREGHNVPRRKGWRYLCNEDLILREGVFASKHAPVPRNLRGRVKMCFPNASRAANGVSRIYCEGFAIAYERVPLAVPHAWLLNPDGEVIDPTWKDPGYAYLGIPFDRTFVSKTLLQQGTFGLLDELDRGPLLVGLPPSEYRHAGFPPPA